MDINKLKLYSPLSFSLIALISEGKLLFSSSSNSSLLTINAMGFIMVMIHSGVLFSGLNYISKNNLNTVFCESLMWKKTMLSTSFFFVAATISSTFDYVSIAFLITFILAAFILLLSWSIDSKVLREVVGENSSRALNVILGGKVSSLTNDKWQRSNHKSGFDDNLIGNQMIMPYADSGLIADDSDTYWHQSPHYTASSIDSSPDVNPASGLIMVDNAIDVAGNFYGFYDHSFSNDISQTNQFSDYDYHNNN